MRNCEAHGHPPAPATSVEEVWIGVGTHRDFNGAVALDGRGRKRPSNDRRINTTLGGNREHNLLGQNNYCRPIKGILGSRPWRRCVEGRLSIGGKGMAGDPLREWLAADHS